MIRLSRLSTRETTTFIFKSTFVSKHFLFSFFFRYSNCLLCIFKRHKKEYKKKINEKGKRRESERRGDESEAKVINHKATEMSAPVSKIIIHRSLRINLSRG